MNAASVYRLCLQAYPRAYRDEHGPEILATLDEAYGGSGLSAREAGALLAGGLRRRTACAAAGGGRSAVLSAVRGSFVVAGLFVGLNALEALAPAFARAGLKADDNWLGRPSAGGLALAIVLFLAVAGFPAALAAGRRRLAGLSLLVAAASAAHVVPFASGSYGRAAAYVPAIGMLVLGSRERPARWNWRPAAIAGGGTGAVALAMLSERIPVGPLTWVFVHEVPIAIGMLVVSALAAPFDGRLGLAAAVAAGVEQAWGFQGLTLVHTLAYLRWDSSIFVPVYAVAGAIWGTAWIWSRSRRTARLRAA